MKLVTGGSGFFGIHLVRKLLDSGEEVRVFDIAEPGIAEIEKSIDFVRGDIRDYSAVCEACNDVDVVYHNVAVLPIARAGRGYWQVNADGTRNLLKACLERGVPKVVHVSTSAVYYGTPEKMPIDENSELHPFGSYGKAKFEAEEICRKYRQLGLNVSIIRPRTIVGPGRLGIFQILFDWLKDGKNLYILGSGNNRFQLTSASDLAEACHLAAKAPSEDFNVGAERFSTLREDLEALAAYARTGSKIVSVNATMARYTLRLLDKLRLSPLVEFHYMTYDKEFFFDISKAKRILGWTPKDGNRDMLVRTYDWYLHHYKELESRYGTSHRYSVKQGILRLLKLVS